MKKKVVLKKLQLNKTKVMSLSVDQSGVIFGGGNGNTIVVQKPKPNPNPQPYPVPQEPATTLQSRTEDCTIVQH